MRGRVPWKQVLLVTAVAGWLAAHAALWPALPPVPRLTLMTGKVLGHGFTPDGRSLVLRGDDGVSVWDLQSGRCERVCPCHATDSRPDSLVVSASGRRAIAIDQRRYVSHLIDLDTGGSVSVPQMNYLNDEQVRTWSIVFVPGGRVILQSVSHVGPGGCPALRLWDTAMAEAWSIPLGARAVTIACAPDGNTAAIRVLAFSPYVRLVDLATAQFCGEVQLQHNPSDWPAEVDRLAFAPDSQTLAVTDWPLGSLAAAQAQVRLVNVRNGRQFATVNGYLAGWTANGRLVVDGAEGLRLLDARGGEVIARLPAPPIGNSVRAGVSADGRFITLWTREYLPDPVRWLLRRSPVQPVHPDRARLVTTVFDARTGQRRATLVGAFGSLAPAREGRTTLATIEPSGTVRLWDVPPRKPGGIVLALMIAEVGLLAAWTASRRRRRRMRPATV